MYIYLANNKPNRKNDNEDQGGVELIENIPSISLSSQDEFSWYVSVYFPFNTTSELYVSIAIYYDNGYSEWVPDIFFSKGYWNYDYSASKSTYGYVTGVEIASISPSRDDNYIYWQSN